MEERRIQLAVEVDSTRSRAGFNDVVQQADSMGTQVERTATRAGRALGGIGNAASGAANQVGTAERSLIGSIQRATAALEAGERGSSRFYESLAGRRGVDVRALEPYLAQLRQVESQQNRVGTSAGQIAAAMRTVPAQFTDIVTSLQGGQNPLTVLLQQGGQLRDQFGSTGVAARALGGYVVGLVNPFTLAAAAVGVLTAAHYAGAAEAEGYARALALSSNTAGATVGQMADAARNIGKVTGSQHEAAQAIAALAGSGQVAAGSLERYGAIAIGVQQDIGRSVETTVEDFAELGRSPLAALDKLNDKYHFVTYATYAQVKALMDQGKATEAAQVAQDAYADAVAKQRDKVAGTLSDWERGWQRIKKAVSGVTDSVIDLALGREKSYNQQIKGLLDERELIEQRIAVAVRKGDEEKQRAFEADLERNKKAINAIRNKQQAEKDAAKAEADGHEKDDAKKKWLEEGDKRLTRPQQLKRDIEQAQNLGNKAFEGEDPVAAERAIQARIALIRKDYSDIFNDGIEAQIAGIKRRGEIDDLVQKRSADALAAMHAVGLVREEDYLAAVASLDDAALARDKARLQDELLLVARKMNSQKEQADLRGQIAELDEKRISRQLQLTDDLMQLEVKRTRAAAENYANVVDKVSGEGDALTKQLQAQRDSNEQIGLSARAIAELEAVRLEALATRKEENADIAEGLDLSGRMSDEYRAQAKALRDLAQAKREGAIKQDSTDLSQATRYLKIVEAIDEQTKRAATGMSASFGKVGTAIGSLTTALSGYAHAQAAVSAQLAEAMKKAGGDPTQAAKASAIAAQQSAQAQIKSYGDMAGAAKGFFSEHTAGYRAMEGAEKAFRAVEMAMAVEAMVRKLFAVESVTAATVAGEATKTAAIVSGTAVQVAADTVKGTSAAAVAVATQATGDPYSAWVRMAAMAAAMAALGFAVAGGGHGDTTAADRQKAQGTGSVLGDSTAKSDSIAQSLDLVAANSAIELSHTAGMLASLRNIENSLDGLGNVIVRTTGITGKLPANTAGAAAQFGRSDLGLTVLTGPIGLALDKITGGLVGKVTSAVLGSVLGGKVTTQDIGITADKASLGSILDGGLHAYQYVDKKKDGGWFRSDKEFTERTALGTEASDQFTKVLDGLAASVTEAGKLLGVGGDDFTRQLDTFVVDLGKISLKDLKGDELQKALETVFSKVGDDLAKFGVGGMEQFQAVGEGYFETLSRIANDYASLDAILASIGTTFGTTGIASVEAREHLIELAGGINELASKTSSFAEHFLTEAERLAPVQKSLVEQLTAMGLASVDTRDEFKQTVLDLVNSGALATQDGAQRYATLMALEDAFNKVYPATEKASSAIEIARTKRELEIQLMELQGNKLGAIAAKRELEIASVDKQLQSLQATVLALQSLKDAQADYEAAVSSANAAMQTAAGQYQQFVDNVKSAQQHFVEAQDAIRTQVQKSLDADKNAKKAIKNEQDKITDGYVSASEKVAAAQQKVVDSFLKLGDTLSEFLVSLDTTELGGKSLAERQAALQARFTTLAAQARAGDATAGGKLPEVAKALLAAGKNSTGSSVDYARLVASVRRTVGEVAAVAASRAGDAPASTPETELQKALDEQARWAEAVTTSGTSFTTASDALLSGYKDAVAEQKTTAEQLAYFTQIATTTNTALGDNQNAMRVVGDDLLAGFYDAQTGLAKAQAELIAANEIRGGLELRQTTALENFVGAVKDVNKGAKDVLDAAGVLFQAASNKLLDGSVKAAEAQQLAQAGMTYWGNVVTTTAAGIAASVQAMATAAGGIQAGLDAVKASQAATKGAQDEAMVRTWYANNAHYQASGKGQFVQVQQFEVDYWLNRLKTEDSAYIKQQFAIAAAHDAGFSRALDVAAFAAGGDHSGGLRLVGEQGMELEATGPSRIFNAAQTRNLLHDIANPGLAEEVALLRQELALLRNDVRIGDAANVSATKDQTRFWRDLTDGKNLNTKVVEV